MSVHDADALRQLVEEAVRFQFEKAVVKNEHGLQCIVEPGPAGLVNPLANEKGELMLPVPVPDFSCVVCGIRQRNLLRCATCHFVLYCDRRCQKKHWRVHRKNCFSKAIRITVGLLSGQEKRLLVSSCISIRKIKALVRKWAFDHSSCTNFHTFDIQLVHDNKSLSDDACTLSDVGITYSATLQCINVEEMEINVQLLSGQAKCIFVSKSSSIRQVKDLVIEWALANSSCTEFSDFDIELVHENSEKPLDDASIIGDVGIAHAHTLTCIIVDDPVPPLVESDSDF